MTEAGEARADTVRQLDGLSDEDMVYLSKWALWSVVLSKWALWSVVDLLRLYDAGRLVRDVDRDTDVLIACEDRDELIRDMMTTLGYALKFKGPGSKYKSFCDRCRELGVELRCEA